MQFKTTYKGKEVLVDYSGASEPWESLEGVVITYTDTGDDIDYNDMSFVDWNNLYNLVNESYQSDCADAAEYLEWD